jgi:putative ABC transport system substrate-binding protein
VTRREFIGVLGGVVFAWPLMLRAQQLGRKRRIGLMMVNAEGDPEGQNRAAAFREGLRELGWAEGRNLQVDYRWAAGEPKRAEAYARDLVTLAPDVIVANGSPALDALHRATRTIPIVFVVVVDPVGAGYVRSLAKPGGNVTGFSTFDPDIGGKWLELLREIAPGVKRVGIVSDPAFRGFAALLREIGHMAPSFGLKATTLVFHEAGDDIEASVAAFAREPDGSLIVLPTAVNNIHRKRLFTLAARHRLPAIYPFRAYASDGGLMSYGFDSNELFRRGASYVSRILNGESPATLPVQAPNKFELVINLKTAKTLGLLVPEVMLARAVEVIE